MSKGIMENTVNIKTVVHSGRLWAGIITQRGEPAVKLYSELGEKPTGNFIVFYLQQRQPAGQVCEEEFVLLSGKDQEFFHKNKNGFW